jgi:hypothetical protein
VGLPDFAHYEFNDGLKAGVDIDVAWATWSVPFDREEDVTFMATAYYLSPAVRKYWEDHYKGKVLWYGTTIEGIADLLENLQKERAAHPAAAVAAVIAAPAKP